MDRRRAGFTLTELLVGLLVLVGFALVIFPGVSRTTVSTHRARAQRKLSNIAKASVAYCREEGGLIGAGAWSVKANRQAASIADYAAVLAFNVELNEGEIWYIDEDPANGVAIYDKSILVGEGDARFISDSVRVGSDEHGYISWTAYSPTLPAADGTTPLLWTRGLGEDGRWRADNDVWAGAGGHIAFGDGHVVWVSNTTDDESKFVDRVTAGQTTENWKRAISSTLFAGTELKSK